LAWRPVDRWPRDRQPSLRPARHSRASTVSNVPSARSTRR
jgi:hypothetical protein